MASVAKTIFFLLLSPVLLLARSDEVLCLKVWPAVPLLRSEDLTSQIIEELPCEQKLLILKFDGDWAQVKTKSGNKGYLLRFFVESQLLERLKNTFQPQVVILDEIDTMLRLSQKMKVLHNMRLRAPQRPTFYDGSDNYLLTSVEPQSRLALQKRLESIEDHGVFGCGSAWLPLPGHPYVCRYVTKIDFARPVPNLPLSDQWANLLHGKAINTMWVLCFIEVDSTGSPIPFDWHWVLPLAVQTEDTDYLVSDLYKFTPEPISSFGTLPTQLLFSARRCKQRSACVGQIRQLFVRQTKISFADKPLLTGLENESSNSEEVRMSRRYKKSLVLGEPYYEFSVYNFRLVEDKEEGDLYSYVDLIVLFPYGR